MNQLGLAPAAPQTTAATTQAPSDEEDEEDQAVSRRPKRKESDMPAVAAKTEGILNLVSEPGAIQIEAAAEGEMNAEGKPRLPRFSMVAYTGGPMRIAGWRYPVVVDLAGLAIPSQNRPIRFGHDAASGVGHTDSIQIQDGKLLAAGIVSRDTVAAREIVASARNGFPWQASIGAAVEESEYVKQNQKVLVNGREFSGPMNVVRRASLGEISFVDLGADGETTAQVAASAMTEPAREGEDSVDDHNNTVGASAAGTAQTPACGERGRRSYSFGPHRPALRRRPRCRSPLRCRSWARRRPRSARRPWPRTPGSRRSAGSAPGGSRRSRPGRSARGGTRRGRELEMLRGTRPVAPAVHFHDDSVSGRVLEAACMLTAKLDKVEDVYDAKTLEAADRRFRGGIGLQELLLGGGLGQRLHRPQLPRPPLGVALRLPPGTRGRVLDDRHRRHPFQRRQQVPARRLLLGRADLAEHLHGPQRLATSRR